MKFSLYQPLAKKKDLKVTQGTADLTIAKQFMTVEENEESKSESESGRNLLNNQSNDQQEVNKQLEHMLDTWEKEGMTEITPRKKKSDDQQASSTQQKVLTLLEKNSSKTTMPKLRRDSLLHIIKTPELNDNNTEHLTDDDLEPLPYQKNTTNDERLNQFQERMNTIERPIIMKKKDSTFNSATTLKNIAFRSNIKELESELGYHGEKTMRSANPINSSFEELKAPEKQSSFEPFKIKPSMRASSILDPQQGAQFQRKQT